eukprot:GHVT01083932.1.p1 GENE.GHVT01083932.1~~GHVT01083932.1.p1  ORF type:complete len:145 (-),score=8.75 GHVT01083932.1:520-954(-)
MRNVPNFDEICPWPNRRSIRIAPSAAPSSKSSKVFLAFDRAVLALQFGLSRFTTAALEIATKRAQKNSASAGECAARKKFFAVGWLRMTCSRRTRVISPCTFRHCGPYRKASGTKDSKLCLAKIVPNSYKKSEVDSRLGFASKS